MLMADLAAFVKLGRVRQDVYDKIAASYNHSPEALQHLEEEQRVSGNGGGETRPRISESAEYPSRSKKVCPFARVPMFVSVAFLVVSWTR
jgi:hypothetical protein